MTRADPDAWRSSLLSMVNGGMFRGISLHRCLSAGHAEAPWRWWTALKLSVPASFGVADPDFSANELRGSSVRGLETERTCPDKSPDLASWTLAYRCRDREGGHSTSVGIWARHLSGPYTGCGDICFPGGARRCCGPVSWVQRLLPASCLSRLPRHAAVAIGRQQRQLDGGT